MAPRPPIWVTNDEPSPKADRWIEREIMVTLAGHAAEHRHEGRRNWRGARGDTDWMIELGCHLWPPGEVLDRYLSFMEARARMFVSIPKQWVRIEALAGALLERRTIGARDARKLCRKAVLDAVQVFRRG